MREPSNDKIEITEKELYDIIERAIKNDWQTVAEVYEMILDEHYAKTERELQELLNSEQEVHGSVATMPNSSKEADNQIKQNPFGG